MTPIWTKLLISPVWNVGCGGGGSGGGVMVGATQIFLNLL